jgi:hypothetical protein
MNCERCENRQALYRAYSDILNIGVCEACASEARGLGIAVQLLSSKEADDGAWAPESPSTQSQYVLGLG